MYSCYSFGAYMNHGISNISPNPINHTTAPEIIVWDGVWQQLGES